MAAVDVIVVNDAVVVVDVKVEGIIFIDGGHVWLLCLVGQRLETIEIEQLADNGRAGRCRRRRTNGGRIQLIVVIFTAFDTVGC